MRRTRRMPSASRSSSRFRVSSDLPATSSSTFGRRALRGWTRWPLPAAAMTPTRGCSTPAVHRRTPSGLQPIPKFALPRACGRGAHVSRERFALAAAAVGVAGGLALTFPLPLQLGRAVLEDGSYDAFQFLWNVWWVRESLVALRTNPFYTRYLFYPEGVPLLFHTFSFALGLASVPLQLTFGLVAAHNLLVIAAPALSVLFAALLAREVVDDPWAALTAGLVAAVNPIAVWFLPVLYLNCGWLIAAVLWAWWRMQRLRRARDVAAALGLLVALVFASQQFAMVALAVVSALGLAGLRAAIVRPGTRAAATALALTLVVAGGALDTRGLRAPLASAAIPAAYDGVRADPDPAAILELPSGLVAGTFAAFTSRWMYYQTAHRKFLLEGTDRKS